MKKTLFIILSILGIGCVGTLGFLFVQSNTTGPSQNQIAATPSPEPQHYKNAEYGYVLDLYPAGSHWEVTDYGEEVKWSGPDHIRLHVLRRQLTDQRTAQEAFDRCRDFGGGRPKPGGRPDPDYQDVSGPGWSGVLVVYKNSYRTDLCIQQPALTIYTFEYYTAGIEVPETTKEQRETFINQIVPNLRFPTSSPSPH